MYGKDTGKVSLFFKHILCHLAETMTQRKEKINPEQLFAQGSPFFAALGDWAGVVPMLESSQDSQNCAASLVVSQGPWTLQ